MIFDIETTTIFIPKIDGNRDKPESEQIRIHINRPNGEELSDLSGMDIIKKMSMDDFSEFKDNRKKKEETIFRTITKTGKAIRNHVTKVENVETREKGEVKPVTTGEQLLQMRGAKAKELIDESMAEILRDELTEKKVKN